MAIEKTVQDDVRAHLVAGGLTVDHAEQDLGANPDYSGAGRVKVQAEIARETINGGQLPAGFPAVALTLTCQTHNKRDPSGRGVGSLARSVRALFETTTLVSDLNALSQFATYYTWQRGPTTRDRDGRFHLLALTYTLVMRPSNATSTTTTTTTTT